MLDSSNPSTSKYSEGINGDTVNLVHSKRSKNPFLGGIGVFYNERAKVKRKTKAVPQELSIFPCLISNNSWALSSVFPATDP